MNVLVLTKYSGSGASSRLRFLQYIPYLKTYNINFLIEPLLDDSYLSDLYHSQKRDKINLLRSYFHRLKILLKIKEIDVIWLEKEIFPMLPGIFEGLLSKLKIPYIVDFDDPTFHSYDLHKSALIRILLKNKIKKVINNSAVVVAGNDYLAEYARTSGASNIVIIPTVVDLNDYVLNKKESPNTKFTVGWIGSPYGYKYINIVHPVLERFFLNNSGRLIVVGSGNCTIPNIPLINKVWQEEKEYEYISEFDVGIMPLEDSPWERGKCGFKLIQYMACALPVIASPVGINNNLIQNKRNGFLCYTHEQWYNALTYLKDNKTEGKQMGMEGRKLVENYYSLQANLPKLLEIFQHFG